MQKNSYTHYQWYFKKEILTFLASKFGQRKFSKYWLQDEEHTAHVH